MSKNMQFLIFIWTRSPYKYTILDTICVEDFFVSKLLFDDTINDTTNDTIKNCQSDIISLIKKTPSITRKEIAQTLNISEPTVARDLKMLQEIGVIKRNGPNKTGYWEILKDGK